jgi:restriction endonuclease S subunit
LSAAKEQSPALPLPAGWQWRRLKFLARVQTGMAKGKDMAGTETVEVPYLRVANVQDGYLDLDDVTTMAVPVADLPRYRLQPGDVLMNEGGDFDKLGRGHVWHGQIDPCIHQNHVFAVRPHGVSPDWLNAYTGSVRAQFYFMGRAKQSTNLASISSTNLMELPVPVPPELVQRRLLALIANETARVDALIEKKTRFIELLREKRQALITHAVDGSQRRPLKYAIHFLTSGPRGWSDAIDADGAALFVQSGDLTDQMKLAYQQAARIDVAVSAEAQRTRLRGGDVVVCITGANTGRVALADEPPCQAFVNQHLCLIRPNRDVLAPAFLALVLHSTIGRDYFEQRQYGLKEGRPQI